ncbi:hypothetical protein [Winogradskyella sp.]|uniref:hypothetical protein n=1 Tax=Winogradskyella sp. TaxID=1883156 RepID=UPI003BA8A515
MIENKDIEHLIKIELEKAIAAYKNSERFTETESVFNELMNYNFDRYKRKLKKEIKRKIKRSWTNPKKGINPELKLDAFLFEHYFPEVKDHEADIYGIIDWEEKKVDQLVIDMGYAYDFADGLEQDPGITMQFYNPFVKNKLGKSYYKDGILITEDTELAKCFQLKGMISIHQAFYELHNENAFDKVHKNDEFYILFGEHDDDCYLLLSI